MKKPNSLPTFEDGPRRSHRKCRCVAAVAARRLRIRSGLGAPPPPLLAVCGEPTNLTIVHRFWTPIDLIKFIGTEESKKSNQCSIDLLTCSVHAVMLLGPRYYRAQMGLAN
jgi:hypothetical protein